MRQTRFYDRDPAAPRPNHPRGFSVYALIERDGTLLLERRVDAPMWSLIAGRVEDDETLIEGLVREVREETGLEVSTTSSSGTFPSRAGSSATRTARSFRSCHSRTSSGSSPSTISVSARSPRTCASSRRPSGAGSMCRPHSAWSSRLTRQATGVRISGSRSSRCGPQPLLQSQAFSQLESGFWLSQSWYAPGGWSPPPPARFSPPGREGYS